MKKLLGLVLAFLTVLGTCILPVEATVIISYGQKEGDFYYILDEDEACITKCELSVKGEIVIPDKIGGCPVTSISRGAFYDCNEITGIKIPKSVERMPSGVFTRCSKLISIEVADGNKNYCSENGVLFNKDKTTIVSYPGGKADEMYILPESVTSMGIAFSSCKSIKGVKIPEGITTLDESAFSGCEGLERVELPDSLKTIEMHAFAHCSSLKDIKIPDGVTNIGFCAFNDCSSLQSVKIPDSVTTIGGRIFYGCRSLKEVEIGNGLTEIGLSEFAGCWELASVILSDSVTSIGAEAFYGCNRLANIEFGNNLTSIGDRAFYTCNSLTELKFGNSLKSIGDEAFFGLYDLTEVTIPDGVTSIGEMAFSNCYDITSITLGKNVESIGDGAFGLCKSLKNIKVAEGNENYFVENGVLYDKDKTTIVIYPAGKTDSEFVIPDSVKTIGENTFVSCDALEEIVVAVGNKNYYSENGVLFNKDKTELIVYPTGKKDGEYIIPDGVTSVGKRAFYGCLNLLKVEMPEGVTTINEEAFSLCRNLVSVKLPGSVTTIKKEAFGTCSSLTDIYYEGIEENFKEIVVKEGNDEFVSVNVYFKNGANKKAVINVYMNDEKIDFDQEPILENGRTLVPVRAIFETLGAKVVWDDSTQTVMATKGDKEVFLQIGSNKMSVDGEVITLDVPAKLLNQRTLVPLRAVSEAFGCTVYWSNDDETHFIYLHN